MFRKPNAWSKQGSRGKFISVGRAITRSVSPNVSAVEMQNLLWTCESTMKTHSQARFSTTTFRTGATITTLKTAMPRKYKTQKRRTGDTYFLAWKSTGKVVNVSLATAPGATVSKVATHKQALSAGSDADLAAKRLRKQTS